MSLAQMCILGASGGTKALSSNSFASDLSNTGVATGAYSAGLTVNTDGTTAGPYASVTSNWYTPTTAGIGAKFWAKLTTSSPVNIVASGSLAGGGWTQLSSAQDVQFTNSGSSNEGTGKYTIQFATDSAGTNVTGTISGNIDVGHIA